VEGAEEIDWENVKSMVFDGDRCQVIKKKRFPKTLTEDSHAKMMSIVRHDT
jgi:hypothetical protein